HLQELTFKGIRLPSSQPRGTPTTSVPDIARPFPRIKDIGRSPPVDDLLRCQRFKDALRWRRDFYAGENLALMKVCNRPGGGSGGAGHFASRLRFRRLRLDCQNDR